MTRTAASQATTRPFHETIIDAIRRCPSPSTGEIVRLLRLIKETAIPAGHDEIIAAITDYFSFSGAGKWAREIRLVKEHVHAQKEAHATTSGSGQSHLLCEIEKTAKGLLAVFREPFFASESWKRRLRERLEHMNKIASTMLAQMQAPAPEAERPKGGRPLI